MGETVGTEQILLVGAPFVVRENYQLFNLSAYSVQPLTKAGQAFQTSMGMFLVCEARTASPDCIDDVDRFNKFTSSRRIKSASRLFTPNCFPLTHPKKALIGTLATIPWQCWLDASLATASGSPTLSDWDHSGMEEEVMAWLGCRFADPSLPLPDVVFNTATAEQISGFPICEICNQRRRGRKLIFART
jgi:hypothetical protein